MRKTRSKQRETIGETNLKWTKVDIALPWRPEPGEVLEGVYGGQSMMRGHSGEYDIWIVHTRLGSYTVSGTIAARMFASAMIEEGEPIRIVYKGRAGKGEFKYKDYDMFVGRT